MRAVKLLILASSVFITSCSGIFAIGEEEFACSASAQGGVCAGIDYVYENREEIYKSGGAPGGDKGVFKFRLNEDYKLILVGKGKRVPIPPEECEEMYCDPIDGCTEEELKKCKEGKLVPEVYEVRVFPDRKVKDVPVPVREEDRVQRIWIEPYVDADGNFVEGHFIYTVVRKGRWLLPDGEPAPKAEE